MLAPAAFKLLVTPATQEEVATARAEQEAASSASSSASSSALDADHTPVPEGSVRCGTCKAVFPKDRLVMHERHCAKRMTKCPDCSQVLLGSDLPKHAAIEHTRLACRCALHFTQKQLHQHQMHDCPERLFKCPNPWCQLLFPFKEFEHHEVSCFMKPTQCVVCQQEVRIGHGTT